MAPNKKPTRSLAVKEYHTVTQVRGPLVFIDRVSNTGFDEMVEVIDPHGNLRVGRVLEAHGCHAVVQMFVSTEGLDLTKTHAHFTSDVTRLGVSPSMLGRILNALGNPIDGGPAIVPDKYLDINGMPINPASRLEPSEFIQTGISAIDGLNSLARGQKLPIFSGSGLPGNQLAAQIAAQARVLTAGKSGGDDAFAVVFAAVGITNRESSFFIEQFRASGSLDRTVVFLNLASDPSIERIITPRAALTTAEYLAFHHGLHVLVILTDMTNYCEALRELSVSREELPARRGYPGYMYSDLASIYERAGRLRGVSGSVTQLILLNMPDDDITHPIPDLTGYITEGQIVLSRVLHQKGIYPPIDVLPSLSRLMDAAIGEGKTKIFHRELADQLYALYAEGRDLEKLITIIGEDSLTDQNQKVLDFSRRFEKEFIGQGNKNRPLEETLSLAWDLLKGIPKIYLKRVSEEFITRYIDIKK